MCKKLCLWSDTYTAAAYRITRDSSWITSTGYSNTDSNKKHLRLLLPGEALLESNTVIDFLYCSPSLRCVQTAQNILKGERSRSLQRRSPRTHWTVFGLRDKKKTQLLVLTRTLVELRFKLLFQPDLFYICMCVCLGLQQDGKLKVRVEPGLFEWTKWVSGNSLPAWIPPADLAAANFSVDTLYR